MANVITKYLPLPGYRMPNATHLNDWAKAINNAFAGLTNVVLAGAFNGTVGATTPSTVAATTVSASSTVTALNATATTSGGAAAAGLAMGTDLLGIYFGTGAPTISAPQGSIYLNKAGNSTSTRLYVNSNGSTTWVAVTTAS